jgi:hypothetical protein
MSIKRSVILRGCPEQNENGTASAQVKPGYLVKGISTVAHQTRLARFPARSRWSATNSVQGIDNTLQGSGTARRTTRRRQGQDGVFDSGDEATVFVASGAGTVNEDTLLGSAGDGTFNVQAAAGAIARSLENSAPSPSVRPFAFSSSDPRAQRQRFTRSHLRDWGDHRG